MHKVVWTNFGDPTTPQEIRRLRRQYMDFARRMGQPVILRHMWNTDDVGASAKQCPACYVPGYDQSKNDCPVCFGVGFVSTENNPISHWINTQGQIVSSDPGTGVRAPRYGGFGEPYLTWLVEPDVIEDEFRINDQGVLIRTYDATGIAPWYPKLSDNDLCINVILNKDGMTIASTEDRFQLKQVQQVTIRGFGRRTRHNSAAQPYLCQQTFKMNKAPSNSIYYSVPADVD